ncbi:MAG: ADP-forming succinate--CoA ligase subunit beta [Sedimentisphaerales bacterium]|nr:ADP-forming succinate--CoA ligase subunit beta [Sedimentisphaerales bacterium]
MLAQYGIAVPRAILVATPKDAADAVASLGGSAMLKGQVLTGGRGKAGAVRAVCSPEQAESVARETLALTVKGLAVRSVLVTDKLDIRNEYYAGLTVDRQARAVGLIVSAAGGMEIEQIAATQPEKIKRVTLDGAEDLAEALAPLFADRALLNEAVATVQKMHKLFREKDCSLVEINPLAICSVPVRASEGTPDGVTTNRLMAADAKIVFDDNALWRHADVAVLRNPEECSTEELEAEEAGLSFVSLDGDIGCMVNGAGLAMATMDGIKLAGGRAANFLDVGGSSNPRKVLDAMRILLRNEALKVILINIFGGITRCNDIAQGILMARAQVNVPVPIVIRLIGTNEAEGRALLQKAGLIVARDMTQAIGDAVRCAKEGATR